VIGPIQGICNVPPRVLFVLRLTCLQLVNCRSSSQNLRLEYYGWRGFYGCCRLLSQAYGSRNYQRVLARSLTKAVTCLGCFVGAGAVHSSRQPNSPLLPTFTTTASSARLQAPFAEQHLALCLCACIQASTPTAHPHPHPPQPWRTTNMT
jgi:hypothetical protein